MDLNKLLILQLSTATLRSDTTSATLIKIVHSEQYTVCWSVKRSIQSMKKGQTINNQAVENILQTGRCLSCFILNDDSVIS